MIDAHSDRLLPAQRARPPDPGRRLQLDQSAKWWCGGQYSMINPRKD